MKVGVKTVLRRTFGSKYLLIATPEVTVTAEICLVVDGVMKQEQALETRDEAMVLPTVYCER